MALGALIIQEKLGYINQVIEQGASLSCLNMVEMVMGKLF
jgi:hypothetical protein